jgi:carbonic anhydrase
MRTIKDLISGYHKFKSTRFQEQRSLYNRLGEGQDPNIMIITCSDSRVVPSSIFSVDAGDIFAVRNVANLVPPYSPDGGYHGTSAALEFAVTGLHVTDILVLGHTNCGGANACLNHASASLGEFLGPWVNIAQAAREVVLSAIPTPCDAQNRLIEQEIVKLSLDNLKTFPFIKDAISNNTLSLHGAIFSIAEADLYWFNTQENVFKPLLPAENEGHV